MELSFILRLCVILVDPLVIVDAIGVIFAELLVTAGTFPTEETFVVSISFAEDVLMCIVELDAIIVTCDVELFALSTFEK